MIMRYTIFDHITEGTEQEIARLLPMVSQQRREQALRYQHLFGQYCCLKSYELLMELLGDDSKPEFIYNEYGQPQLANGPFFFNLSLQGRYCSSREHDAYRNRYRNDSQCPTIASG